MIRIVGGKLRGRRLVSPPANKTRPTADRTREAIFNILQHGFHHEDGRSILQGTTVADMFAGSGAMGIEALSRGANHCFFIEQDRTVLSVLRQNIHQLGLDDYSTLLPRDALIPGTAPASCNILFADPPYGQDFLSRALPAWLSAGWIKPGGVMVVERAADDRYQLPTTMTLLRTERYGRATVDFIAVQKPCA